MAPTLRRSVMWHAVPALALWCFAQPAAPAVDAAEAVRRHAETLARIHSLYVKTESWWEPASPSGVKPPGSPARRKKTLEFEGWRVGPNVRTLHRAYVTF